MGRKEREREVEKDSCWDCINIEENENGKYSR